MKKGRRKKHVLLTLIIIILLIGAGALIYLFNFGTTVFAKTDISDSKFHKKEDIEECIDIIKDDFRNNYDGCILDKIWYNDTYAIKHLSLHMSEFITIGSDFHVSSLGGNDKYKANEEIKEFTWTLKKDSDGHWRIDNASK